MEYHDPLEADEPDLPPLLSPIEESEARAASLKTEMQGARKMVEALNAALLREKAVRRLINIY
jgi:hypothetical protein